MVELAAFKVLLHRYVKQPDVVVGIPVAGRNQVETEGLMGFFVNTLVLRDDLSGNPTFADVMARVKETILGAFSNADVPFEKIVEVLQPERISVSIQFFRSCSPRSRPQSDRTRSVT